MLFLIQIIFGYLILSEPICGGCNIGLEELANEHFSSDAALGSWPWVVVSIFGWYWDSLKDVVTRKEKENVVIKCVRTI